MNRETPNSWKEKKENDDDRILFFNTSFSVGLEFLLSVQKLNLLG